MSDYASAPVQPIVQGLVTIPTNTPGGAVVFTGKGVSSIIRDPASPLGAFILTLDAGLPGNAGALQEFPDVIGATAPFAPDARTMVTVRGNAAVSPPTTTITQIAVAYLTPVNPAVGITQIEVVLSIAGAPTDPVGAGGSGFEVIVWKGIEAP